MRTGDTIKHIPSGELWTVAWADEREVICCGWPETFARREHCVLIEACSDEEHWSLVRQLAVRPSDSRGYRCWALLEQLLQAQCDTVMHL